MISLDGTIELHESSLDNLRLARKSLQKSYSNSTTAQSPHNNPNNNNLHPHNHPSPSYLMSLSEYELEHRAFVEIQDLYISLYLVNRDLWRYVILYL